MHYTPLQTYYTELWAGLPGRDKDALRLGWGSVTCFSLYNGVCYFCSMQALYGRNSVA